MKYIAITPAYPPRNAAMTPVVERFVESLSMPGYIISEKDILYKSADKISQVGKITDNIVAKKIYEYRIRLVTKITKAYWPDKWHKWSRKAFMQACSIIGETNEEILLITFSSPVSSHLQGIKLKKKYPKIKWIAYIADPLVNGVHYNQTTKRHKKNISDTEKAIIEIADATVTLSKRHHEFLIQKYEAKSKIHYVPHSFSDVPAIEKRSETKRKPLVAHFGNVYPPRSILPFIRAVVDSTIAEQFTFANYGCITPKDRETVQTMPEYEIKNTLPYKEFIKKIRDADALVLIEGMNSTSSLALPSKLIEYIGANRPVFGFCYPGSEGERICHEMNFAYADITNPNECTDKLHQFLSSMHLQTYLLTNNNAARKIYTKETTRKRVTELVKSILANCSSRNT